MVAQVVESIPPSKTRRLGMQPQIWRCGNPECTNLISDVNQKTIPKTYCSTACRDTVNRKKFNQKHKMRTCVICGCSLEGRNRKTKYCSTTCYWKTRVKGKSTCSICSTEFELVLYGRKKYCSPKCNLVGRYVQVIKKLGYKAEVKLIA